MYNFNTNQPHNQQRKAITLDPAKNKFLNSVGIKINRLSPEEKKAIDQKKEIKHWLTENADNYSLRFINNLQLEKRINNPNSEIMFENICRLINAGKLCYRDFKTKEIDEPIWETIFLDPQMTSLVCRKNFSILEIQYFFYNNKKIWSLFSKMERAWNEYYNVEGVFTTDQKMTLFLLDLYSNFKEKKFNLRFLNTDNHDIVNKLSSQPYIWARMIDAVRDYSLQKNNSLATLRKDLCSIYEMIFEDPQTIDNVIECPMDVPSCKKPNTTEYYFKATSGILLVICFFPLILILLSLVLLLPTHASKNFSDALKNYWDTFFDDVATQRSPKSPQPQQHPTIKIGM